MGNLHSSYLYSAALQIDLRDQVSGVLNQHLSQLPVSQNNQLLIMQHNGNGRITQIKQNQGLYKR